MDPKPKITPKDFFLWLTAMVFFYVSVFSFISLIFAYLNYAFPDPLQYYSSDPYSGGISYQMASLIVLFPLFVVLMRIIHKNIEKDPTRADLWVRRWALYLTLFFAGVTIAGDLITLLMYFFNGDITVRFVLKVLVILLVAGAGFLHFLADLKGFWERNPSQARLMGWAAGVLVIFTILAGFFIIGTPWQARQYRFDEQKLTDLQNIDGQIRSYWQAKRVLPPTLGDLSTTFSYFTVPMDSQTGVPYEYKIKSSLSYDLCASFNAPTQVLTDGATRLTKPVVATPNPEAYVDNMWTHTAGHACFTRTIDPDLYPVYPTKPI